MGHDELGMALRTSAEDEVLSADHRECIRCLARVVEKDMLSRHQLRQAFGAPGDWGYGTPIGTALAKIYQGA